MKSAFLLGTTDYIGFKTTAVYRLHLVELVNGKKFAKKSNFSKKTFNTTRPLKHSVLT